MSLTPNEGRDQMSTSAQQAGTKARTWRRVLGAATLLGGTVLLASCARNSPQDTWKPKGDSARKIDNLQRPVFLVAGIIGVLVFLTVGFAIARFRDRGQPIPKQSHGKPALEIVLTIIPFIILATIGGVGIVFSPLSEIRALVVAAIVNGVIPDRAGVGDGIDLRIDRPEGVRFQAGRMKLDPPVVIANYLAHEYDRRTSIAALRLTRRIAEQPAFKDFLSTPL